MTDIEELLLEDARAWQAAVDAGARAVAVASVPRHRRPLLLLTAAVVVAAATVAGILIAQTSDNEKHAPATAPSTSGNNSSPTQVADLSLLKQSQSWGLVSIFDAHRVQSVVPATYTSFSFSVFHASNDMRDHTSAHFTKGKVRFDRWTNDVHKPLGRFMNASQAAFVFSVLNGQVDWSTAHGQLTFTKAAVGSLVFEPIFTSSLAPPTTMTARFVAAGPTAIASYPLTGRGLVRLTSVATGDISTGFTIDGKYSSIDRPGDYSVDGYITSYDGGRVPCRPAGNAIITIPRAGVLHVDLVCVTK